jgi:hypothetical protein
MMGGMLAKPVKKRAMDDGGGDEDDYGQPRGNTKRTNPALI